MPPLAWPILAWYLLLSLITFFAFALDKRAAVHDRSRIRERTLHILELLGGWPGAMLAMHLIRHKNRKFAYARWTYLIAIVHASAWIWFSL